MTAGNLVCARARQFMSLPSGVRSRSRGRLSDMASEKGGATQRQVALARAAKDRGMSMASATTDDSGGMDDKSMLHKKRMRTRKRGQSRYSLYSHYREVKPAPTSLAESLMRPLRGLGKKVRCLHTRPVVRLLIAALTACRVSATSSPSLTGCPR